MVRWRLVVASLVWTIGPIDGWWQAADEEEAEVPNVTCWDEPVTCFQRQVHATVAAAQVQFSTLTTWDSLAWTLLDTLLSGAGWLVFGQSWASVRTGCSMIFRVAFLMGICLVLHYFLSLAWPLCSLVIGTFLTIVWVVRGLVRCCGRTAFYAQRMAGGVPEVTGATFIGPDTGEIPETADLRKMKKGANEDRWVLLRRDGYVVIIKVTENAAIKSSGMYLSFDPDATRGDAQLLLALKGYERVHLCRHDSCPEEGQHFKSYALARQLNPERFHLLSTAAGAQRTGMKTMGWLFSKAHKSAKRLKDYASESEREEVGGCCAHLVRWEGEAGRVCLSDHPCKNGAATDVEMLEEDRGNLPADQQASLCSAHAVRYLTLRATLKCSYGGCQRLGAVTKQGLRLCGVHQEQASTSSRRSSRSRSRARDPHPGEDEGEERAEGEGDDRARRRGRAREVTYQVDDTESFLRDVREEKEEEPPALRRRRVSSPGHTPKSSVQHSLARMGMINSPDRRPIWRSSWSRWLTGGSFSWEKKTFASSWQPKQG